MSWLQGMAQQIALDGFGTYQESGAYDPNDPFPIFIGAMLSGPAKAIAISPYGGPEASMLLGYDEPSLQIRTRGGEDFTESWDLAQALYNRYHGKGPFNLPDGTRVISMIGNQSGPVPLGRDENNWYENTVNFRVEMVNKTGNRQ